MLDGYTFPKTWYQALVARAQGDTDGMRRLLESTRRTVEEDRRQCSDDPKTKSMLGLIDAALGRKEDALREGRSAVDLLPISKDAYDGPILATNLAVIYAQVGEHDRAIEELAKLVILPNGPTAGTLRVEPEWNPLRGDSRFEKLVAG